MSGMIDSFFSAVSSLFFTETSPIPEEVVSSPKSAVSREEWFPSRPKLTPPQSLPLSDRRLLTVTENSRELGNEITEILNTRLQGIKDKIKEVSNENMRILREAALRAQESNFWSMLRKIATALISAVSIIFGISVAASGGAVLIGGAMIASGILSLSNFALSEIGAWDWIADQLAHENEELKKQLVSALPIAVGILAGGIGLIGSVNGIATGAVNFAEKAMLAAQTTIGVFDGLTTLGKGAADARLLWTQADLKQNQGELTVEQQKFGITLDEIKASLGDFKDINKKTKKTVEKITQSNTQLTR